MDTQEHPLKFQKDLIVWKLIGKARSECLMEIVSEGLNSVETRWKERKEKEMNEFQKDLIVWKQILFTM